MVGRSRSGNSGNISGRVTYIDRIGAGEHPLQCTENRARAISEALEKCRGFFLRLGQEGDGAQALHRKPVGRGIGGRFPVRDELDDNAVRVFQAQHRLAELVQWTFHRHPMGDRPRQPFAERVLGNRKGDLGDLSVAHASLRPVLPDEEGHEGSRLRIRISVEEMQLLGILEAACALDEVEPQEAEVEIDILLHPAGDERDMMNAGGEGRDRGHGAPLL